MDRRLFLVVNNDEAPRFAPSRPSRRPERPPLLREVPASREQIAEAMAKIRRILDMEPSS